jgi:hypothetical protein
VGIDDDVEWHSCMLPGPGVVLNEGSRGRFFVRPDNCGGCDTDKQARILPTGREKCILLLSF